MTLDDLAAVLALNFAIVIYELYLLHKKVDNLIGGVKH